jgi:hypothetical protein
MSSNSYTIVAMTAFLLVMAGCDDLTNTSLDDMPDMPDMALDSGSQVDLNDMRADASQDLHTADLSSPQDDPCILVFGVPCDQLQQDYLKATNTGAVDQLGYSVALSGDTLAVGAMGEASANGSQDDDSAPFGGAVYVFTRSDAIWTQQAYLKASNPDSNDKFGYSVALSGDTLAVSAPGESSDADGVGGEQGDDSVLASGAVYMFTRAGDTWSQDAYLKASHSDANDQFGCALSLSGDTLAVGAYGESSGDTGVNGDATDNVLSNSGAAYVFARSSGAWTQQAYLKASNPDFNDNFGWAVSVSGDTLAVSAYLEDSSATGIDGDQLDDSAGSSGAVYMFTRAGDTWSQSDYVKASNTGATDQFGYALSLEGDLLAVGAPGEGSNARGVNGGQEDNSASRSGAVYLFARDELLWTQQAYVKAPNSQEADLFGHAVALSGDTLAVSAPLESSEALNLNGDELGASAKASGAVYVFVREQDVWAPNLYIKAPNTEKGDHFGQALAMDGDTLAVGAPHESSNATGTAGDLSDNSTPSSGAVYVYQP